MAKKSRRARKRQSTKRQVVRQVTPQAQAAPRQAAAAARASEAEAASAGVNFAEEYAYVLSDLKRIAIIAAAMLVVLVALSFVIR